MLFYTLPSQEEVETACSLPLFPKETFLPVLSWCIHTAGAHNCICSSHKLSVEALGAFLGGGVLAEMPPGQGR